MSIIRFNPFTGQTIVDNVFCPTGEGGGKDPTCGKGSGLSRSDFGKMTVAALKKKATKVKGVQVQVGVDRVWSEEERKYIEKPLFTETADMYELDVDGVPVRFTNKTAAAALETLKASKDVHPNLWKQNSSVNFVTDQDPLKVLFPSMFGDTDIQARVGPNKDMAVWEGRPLTASILAHESGHSLQQSMSAKDLDVFKGEQKVGDRGSISNGVTAFGKTSRVEDFSEFAAAYNDVIHLGKAEYNGATVATLKKRPKGLAVMKKVLGD